MRKVAMFICSAMLVVGMVGIAGAISFSEIIKLNHGTGSVFVSESATLLLLGFVLIGISFLGKKTFRLKSK